MSSKPEKYEYNIKSPESGTVRFLSHKLSNELPMVPDQFFSIEAPDPIMIVFLNADSFRQKAQERMDDPEKLWFDGAFEEILGDI